MEKMGTLSFISKQRKEKKKVIVSSRLPHTSNIIMKKIKETHAHTHTYSLNRMNIQLENKVHTAHEHLERQTKKTYQNFQIISKICVPRFRVCVLYIRA